MLRDFENVIEIINMFSDFIAPFLITLPVNARKLYA